MERYLNDKSDEKQYLYYVSPAYGPDIQSVQAPLYATGSMSLVSSQSEDRYSFDDSVSYDESILSEKTRESDASSVSTTVGTIPWHLRLLQPAQVPIAQIDHGYRLPCEFKLIGCEISFHPLECELWISHSLSHFVNVPPPGKAICTFCDEVVFEDARDPHANWQARMTHIRDHMEELVSQGLAMNTPYFRPDFFVLEYMYNQRLIAKSDYESATSFTERPPCRDLHLVPADFETPQMRLRRERQEREQATVADPRKEERQREILKTALKEGEKQADSTHRRRKVHVQQLRR